MEEAVSRSYLNTVGFHANDKTTLLFDAYSRGDLKLVKYLITVYGIGFQSYGTTPLHVACECGCVDIVTWLTKSRATLNHKSLSDGNTPLHIACERGHLDVVKILLIGSVK